MDPETKIFICSKCNNFSTNRQRSFTRHVKTCEDITRELKQLAKKSIKKDNINVVTGLNVQMEENVTNTPNIEQIKITKDNNTIVKTNIDILLEAVAELRKTVLLQDEHISSIIKMFCNIEQELQENKHFLHNVDVSHADLINKVKKWKSLLKINILIWIY